MYIFGVNFWFFTNYRNYDPKKKKTVGGKNGYGTKLTNIYSKWFLVETTDPINKKKYCQKWEDNMENRNNPVITKCSPTECKKFGTKITFLPDYSRSLE